MQFRIVKCREEDGYEYCLQIKEWFKWRTTCGADRGASGCYHYQLDKSGNPFYLVRYTIPEIIREKKQPHLSYTVKIAAILKSRFEKMGKIEEIISVDKIQKELAEHAQRLIYCGIKSDQMMPRYWIPFEKVKQELIEIYIEQKGW